MAAATGVILPAVGTAGAAVHPAGGDEVGVHRILSTVQISLILAGAEFPSPGFQPAMTTLKNQAFKEFLCVLGAFV